MAMNHDQNREWWQEAIEKVKEKMEWVSEKSKEKIPYTTVNGTHDNRADKSFDADMGIYWWTNGFWGGMMWMMYQETGEERCIAHPVHPHGWSASAVRWSGPWRSTGPTPAIRWIFSVRWEGLILRP